MRVFVHVCLLINCFYSKIQTGVFVEGHVYMCTLFYISLYATF